MGAKAATCLLTGSDDSRVPPLPCTWEGKGSRGAGGAAWRLTERGEKVATRSERLPRRKDLFSLYGTSRLTLSSSSSRTWAVRGGSEASALHMLQLQLQEAEKPLHPRPACLPASPLLCKGNATRPPRETPSLRHGPSLPQEPPKGMGGGENGLPSPPRCPLPQLSPGNPECLWGGRGGFLERGSDHRLCKRPWPAWGHRSSQRLFPGRPQGVWKGPPPCLPVPPAP